MLSFGPSKQREGRESDAGFHFTGNPWSFEISLIPEKGPPKKECSTL